MVVKARYKSWTGQVMSTHGVSSVIHRSQGDRNDLVFYARVTNVQEDKLRLFIKRTEEMGYSDTKEDMRSLRDICYLRVCVDSILFATKIQTQ